MLLLLQQPVRCLAMSRQMDLFHALGTTLETRRVPKNDAAIREECAANFRVLRTIPCCYRRLCQAGSRPVSGSRIFQAEPRPMMRSLARFQLGGSGSVRCCDPCDCYPTTGELAIARVLWYCLSLKITVVAWLEDRACRHGPAGPAGQGRPVGPGSPWGQRMRTPSS